MTRCPAGHESAATDYCDTCGVAMPVGGAGADAGEATGQMPVAPTVASAPAATCPNCGAPTTSDALFCESCGYDFTTGTLPRPVDPAEAAAAAADPAPSAASPAPAGDAPTSSASTNPSPATTGPAWVAEVWIDPDWYADQESTDPLPSPGLPTVVALRHTSLLVGRASRSRGIHPDLDLGTDSGISRRHCQLTTDGSRWFVEDLGSSNGTYVGDTAGPLPTTPVRPGQRVEVGDDDRIYLGAWTRIVLRPAAPGEA